MKLFSDTITNLEQGLNYSSIKNKTIAQNLSNADTPNYKAKDVQFKNHLNQAQHNIEAKRTHSKHIPFGSEGQNYQITARNDVTYNHNGNSVDLDKEMTELAENQIYYQALVERINGKFNSLKEVLRGGN
ncbi:flagellar basal body rod protein FlgB [Aquisalibacillus elongatus]|uniref:Flagellar basal body rod protein FlgB n=1 Tax=Aquisalibacillus elongatus TaxID=485577 RepID=A0A3N5CFB4_9BACI|nr:flagellar basal body rod protein FlgB [Aquisalibacillus elongatus]RPF56001.1 flagellar basal-body rod protein FlgB [Aquisalibacillus elongatus]